MFITICRILAFLATKARAAPNKFQDFRIVAVIFLTLCAGITGGCRRTPEPAQTVVVPADLKEINLNENTEYLRDSTQQLTIKDILKAPRSAFKTGQRQGLNFGHTKDVVWARIRLRPEHSQSAMLALSPSFLDIADVFIELPHSANGSRDFSKIELGDHRPFPQGSPLTLKHIAPVTLTGDEDLTLYIRLEPKGSALNFSASLFSQKYFPHTTRIDLLIFGVWIGWMTILLCIQIIFYCFNLKLSHLFLAIGTLSVICVYTGSFGISRFFFFQNGGSNNDIFLSVSMWLGLIVGPPAAIEILKLRARAPWLTGLLLFASFSGIVGVITVVTGQHLIFAPYGSALIIAVATAVMIRTLVDFNRLGNISQLHAAAYTALWLGLMSTLIYRDGLLDFPDWTFYGHGFASTLQSLLLTCAIAVELRSAEALNYTMQRDAIEQAQSAERRAVDLVELRTSELAIAKKVAEDALKTELASKEQQLRFLEIISHQYRTPLAAIRSTVDSIGFSLSPSDAENLHRLDRIRRGIARLVETIETAMMRSRIQGASFEPEPIEISWQEVALSVQKRLTDLFPSANIELIVDDVANRVMIQVDLEMLQIAIVNLVENSVKFSRLSQNSLIKIRYGIQSENAFVCVYDNGIGIPENEINSVMDESIRATNAIFTEGTGIGLFLSRKIVRSFGGALTIKSEINKWTATRISIPTSSAM